MPGSMGHLADDLQEIAAQGITAIVSLSEEPLMPAMVAESGMDYLHLPIDDYTPPTLDQIESFVTFVQETRGKGGIVMVHCHAGIGRTGTMLAAFLVKEGKPADVAIEEIRLRRPGSIETHGQEAIIRAYEKSLKEKAR